MLPNPPPWILYAPQLLFQPRQLAVRSHRWTPADLLLLADLLIIRASADEDSRTCWSHCRAAAHDWILLRVWLRIGGHSLVGLPRCVVVEDPNCKSISLKTLFAVARQPE